MPTFVKESFILTTMKVCICVLLVSYTLEFLLSLQYLVPFSNLLYVLYKKCFLSIFKRVIYNWYNMQVRNAIWKKTCGTVCCFTISDSKWSFLFQMYQKRLFKSLYFVPMISIVFLEERGGNYFYVGWLLIFSRVLTLTYCDFHVCLLWLTDLICLFSHSLLVHLFPVLETMLFENLVR